MADDVAGDPMCGVKWTRRTTERIAEELRAYGIEVCANTVAKLLRGLEFALRVNNKKLSGSQDPGRDAQFSYIAAERESFARQGLPIVSVDSKKRELVGSFKNAGTTWCQAPTLVNDHDFRSDASGIALPYGIYDVGANLGYLFVGTSHDTPQWAADNIARWWVYQGRRHYPEAADLLVLADGGGSNGQRNRGWKHALQHRLCDRHGLSVTVCHYPTGASKWNPIEHRLFSEISKNWAGRPLDTYETILNHARTTRTSTGLEVNAYLVQTDYPKGLKFSDKDMQELQLRPHDTQPNRNYTLSPR
ncbi:MAG: ISAzo13 family transposase [Candidatus Dormiibacterota bacterium]